MSEIEVNSMFVYHGRFAVRALRMQRSLRIFIVPELYLGAALSRRPWGWPRVNLPPFTQTRLL